MLRPTSLDLETNCNIDFGKYKMFLEEKKKNKIDLTSHNKICIYPKDGWREISVMSMPAYPMCC